MRKLEGIGLEGKFSVPLVAEKQRSGSANHQQILQTPVFKIREQSAGRGIEHADAGLFGHILKGSISAIAIEPVGKSGGLANIEIVETILVEVAHCHAVVSVDVQSDKRRPRTVRQ